MSSLRKSKSVRGTNPHLGERKDTGELRCQAWSRASDKVLEIPPEIEERIENQRGMLVTVITLLHCLHVVLQHREGSIDNERGSHVEVAARWTSLPEMTAMLLERTHAVLSGLDSTNLTRASKVLKS